MNTIKDNLRKLMIEHCETQESLAKKAGLSDAMIGHILAGKRVGSHETHIKLAKALNVELAEVLEGKKVSTESISNERIINLEQDVDLLKNMVAYLLKEKK